MNSYATLDVEVYRDHKDHWEWEELPSGLGWNHNPGDCDELFPWLPTSTRLGYTDGIHALSKAPERASSILDS